MIIDSNTPKNTSHTAVPPSLLNSFFDALWSFSHPRILWHLLWPILVGFSIWILLYLIIWWFSAPMLIEYSQGLEEQLPSWLIHFGFFTFFMVIAQILAHIILGAILLPLIPFTFVLLLSLISLPLIIPIIAEKHYPELEKKGNVLLIQSIWHTLKASLIFVSLYLSSTILLFIFFQAALIPAHLLIIALLNKQTFSFDALSEHATSEEYETILEQQGTPMMLLGGMVSFLSYVPFVNLLATAMAALWFVHYGMASLRHLRQQSKPKRINPHCPPQLSVDNH